MAQKKVLVTGMSGLIGGLVRERIEGKYTLSALNRRPVEGIKCHQADIADLDAIRPAFEGVDVVVHLAAMAQPGMTWGRFVKCEYRRVLQRIRGIAAGGC